MEKTNKERRLFLKKALTIGSGICATGFAGKYLLHYPGLLALGDDGLPSPTIALAQDDNVYTGAGGINAATVSNMIHKSVMLITGLPSQEKAWQSMFKPNDVVGIKLNCLSGKTMSPHVEVVGAIIQGLKMAGVKDGNIRTCP